MSSFNYEDYSRLAETNFEKYVSELSEWIKINSVSHDPECHPKCKEMVEIASKRLEGLGFQCMIVENPKKSSVGQPLPPVILAEKRIDPKYKTLCIYGHLDVQPASLSDGWDTDPFVLTEKDGNLYGRGTSDDKGPVLAWLSCLEIFKLQNYQPPINIKFCLEAMEECSSEGLDMILFNEKDKFFKDVDFLCISDNSWIGTEKPCLTYGLRGVIHGTIIVSGPKCDLHSGCFGGCVYEPLSDIIHLMSELAKKTQGVPSLPGLMDDVMEVKPEEYKGVGQVDFDVQQFKDSIGLKTLRSDKKEDVLLSRWSYPALSLHGIEGAYSGPGVKTVIPSKVMGKFSLRIVPKMDVQKTIKILENFLQEEFKKLKSPNEFSVKIGGAPAWLADCKGQNMTAASDAVEQVFGTKPDFTREGGSIPITLEFDAILKKDVILLPIGCSDDGPHSQNEKMRRRNLLYGIKVFGCYIENLSKIQ